MLCNLRYGLLYALLTLMPACSKETQVPDTQLMPPSPSEAAQTAQATPAAPASPPDHLRPAVGEARPADPAAARQSAAQSYLKLRFSEIEQRYQAALAACSGRADADDCVASATAAQEAEQAAARVEQQARLQDLAE